MQQPQSIDLTKLSVTELKALAYDRIALKEQTERELATINEQIRVKVTEQQKEEQQKTNGLQKVQEAEVVN